MSSSPLFISLIPNLMQGDGHILPYHGAVKAAAEGLGWEYRAWIPVDGEAAELRAAGVLSAADLEAEGGLLSKLGRVPLALQWGDRLAAQLRQLEVNEATESQSVDPGQAQDAQRPVILFLERFIHLQLLGVWWGLRQLSPGLRRRLHLWILYRRDVHRDQTRPVYRWLQTQLSQLLPGQCACLTDSEPLGRSLQTYFQTPFTVMPIPHTDFPELMPLPIHPDPIRCWWPGSPREEKGWSILKSLIQTPYAPSPALELVVAQAAQLKTQPGGITVKVIGDRLSREEYTAWLNQSHGILLPYDPIAYQERTSGIFTEAIIAGRIPFVTAGTWMAEELERYDLGELAIAWDDPVTVWRSIVNRVNQPDLRPKLTAMRDAYRQFHCLDRYAEVLQSLALAHSVL